MCSERSIRDHVSSTSADLQADRIAQLRAIMPEAFTEGKLDLDKLRTALGEERDERGERYTFSWAGRREAQRRIQEQSRGTLIPAPTESLDWDTTQHVFIEGENLEVLKLLYRAYYGRVKLIYIDPPYNTGNDFVYPDNYGDPLDTYLKLTGQKNGNGDLLTSNPETSGRYHSRWLSMIYPRLFVARQLLRDDGLIFVSIDDHEVHNLRALMNEVFGEENFIASIVWQKTYSPANDKIGIDAMHDYIICYQRSKNSPVALLPRTAKQDNAYSNPDNDPRGVWKAVDSTRAEHRDYAYFPITTPSGKTVYPTKGRSWIFTEKELSELLADNRLWFGRNGSSKPSKKLFLTEVKQGLVPTTWWSHEDAGHNDEAKKELKSLLPEEIPFETPKPTRLIKRILQIGTTSNTNDIILDFFSGSSTTADSVLQLNKEDKGNRRFIMIQFPERTKIKDYPTIAEIGKERIRRVIAKLKAERNGQLDLDEREQPEDLGFRVYKFAPSLIKQWPGHQGDDAEEYIALALSFVDLLVEGWTPEGVLWEVALKEGLSLSSRVETVPETGPNKVQCVTDPDTGRSFFICLDDVIDPDLQAKLNLDATDLFVCRDAAIDETTHANLALACHIKTL